MAEAAVCLYGLSIYKHVLHTALRNVVFQALIPNVHCRLWQGALEQGGIVKLVRVPDGQRLSNARLKSKGDIASERFLTMLLGDRVGPAVPTAYMFIACCAKMTAVAAITSIISSHILFSWHYLHQFRCSP